MTEVTRILYAMEEGDYDRYWVAEISPTDFKSIVGILSDVGFPDIEETYGDWEVWAITLQAGNTEARVGQVLRDYHEGFEKALTAIEDIVEKVKESNEVDSEEFIKYFTEPESNRGGAS